VKKKETRSIFKTPNKSKIKKKSSTESGGLFINGVEIENDIFFLITHSTMLKCPLAHAK
jgi:hypothetical protein